MANPDWSQCSAVESIPGKVSGAWVFRDTRLPVATVIENLEDLSVEEVMEQFDVTREQIAAVLEFVAQSLRTTIPPQSSELVNAHSRSAVMEGKAYADHGEFIEEAEMDANFEEMLRS